MIPVVKILFPCPSPYKFKKSPYKKGFVWWLPIVSSKYRHLYQFCYVKIFSTNQDGNLVLLDDPGRVRSQKTSVVCQIQRFDFECILVVSRKVIMGIPPVLGTKPLYIEYTCRCVRGSPTPPGKCVFPADCTRRTRTLPRVRSAVVLPTVGDPRRIRSLQPVQPTIYTRCPRYNPR